MGRTVAPHDRSQGLREIDTSRITMGNPGRIVVFGHLLLIKKICALTVVGETYCCEGVRSLSMGEESMSLSLPAGLCNGLKRSM